MLKRLLEAGLISKKDLVKILGNGKLTSKLDVKGPCIFKIGQSSY